jgi:Tfp pilus assembly protein PilZ
VLTQQGRLVHIHAQAQHKPMPMPTRHGWCTPQKARARISASGIQTMGPKGSRLMAKANSRLAVMKPG